MRTLLIFGFLLVSSGLVGRADESALSDEEADAIAIKAVDRRASLTVVTLPRPDMTLAGFTYTNGCAAKVWIDTETKAVLGVGREAD